MLDPSIELVAKAAVVKAKRRVRRCRQALNRNAFIGSLQGKLKAITYSAAPWILMKSITFIRGVLLRLLMLCQDYFIEFIVPGLGCSF